MRGVAYVNGAYVPLARAAVSVHDRGFLFGDAVYEVWPIRAGELHDNAEHLTRLKRSLDETRMSAPMSDRALMSVMRETMRRNGARDGIVYLQISRGAPAERDHAFPSPSVTPTLVVTARNLSLANLAKRLREGVKVVTTPEIRWARCDIKSVNLLPNVLARQQAKDSGAAEAWFVDADGFVTEGASTTAWIIDQEGRLRTRDLSNRILHGVTRAILLREAQARQMPVIEQPFTPADVAAAREAFITSAGNPVVPVVAIDGKPIADGKPGPMAAKFRDIYLGAGPV